MRSWRIASGNNTGEVGCLDRSEGLGRGKDIDLTRLIPVAPAGAYGIQNSSPISSVPTQVSQISPGPPNCCCLFFNGSSPCTTKSVSFLNPLRVPLKSLPLNGRQCAFLRLCPFPLSDLQVNPQLSCFSSHILPFDIVLDQNQTAMMSRSQEISKSEELPQSSLSEHSV